MSLETLTVEAVLQASEEILKNPDLKVAGASPSKSYFLRYNNKILGQKLVIKRALEILGDDRQARKHQSKDGHKKLVGLGFNDEEGEPFAFYSQDRKSAEWYLRNRKFVNALQRSSAFRSQVMEIWKSKCALTGCRSEPALEAAHLHGVGDGGSDDSENGIALRADIHKLYDSNLIAINPSDCKIWIYKGVSADYGKLEGKFVKFPKVVSKAALATRWAQRFGES